MQLATLGVTYLHQGDELPVKVFEGGHIVRLVTLPPNEVTKEGFAHMPTIYEILLINFDEKVEPQTPAEALRDHTTTLIFEHGLMPALVIGIYMGEPSGVATTLPKEETDALWETYNIAHRQRVGFLSRLLVDYETRKPNTAKSIPSKFTYRKNFAKEVL